MMGKHNFWGQFHRCMHEILDELEVKEKWAQMLEECDLQQNTWLMGIYQLREKWAKYFMKTAFTLGVRSTQLSESLNSDLKIYEM